MTHFYGTEEELKVLLAQKTEKALADIALGKVYTIGQVKEGLDNAKNKHHAHV